MYRKSSHLHQGGTWEQGPELHRVQPGPAAWARGSVSMFVQVLPSFLTIPFLPSTGHSRRCRGTPTLSSLMRRYPRFLTLWLFLPGTSAQKTQLSPELAHRPECVCTRLFVNTVSVALEPGSRTSSLSHTVRVISSLDLWLTRWVTLGEDFNRVSLHSSRKWGS